MSRIFISYRREDSAGYAGRIYDRLSQHFGPDQIFMDIDNIRPGMDFVEVIEKAVGSCDVLIALMGNQWVSIVDSQGNKRLSNPNDFVRLEIKTALKRNILVIPALVRGAAMPQQQDLPDDLKRITRRNAIEIADSRFHSDVDRLIAELDAVLGTTSKASTRTPATKRPGTTSQNTRLRILISMVGFVLMAWVLAEAWFVGLVRTGLVVLLAPVPFVILGIDHLRNGRTLRGIVFLASLGLIFAEVSPFQPYDVLPSVVRVAINVLTSILIPLAVFWAIQDLVRERSSTKTSKRPAQ